METNGFDLKRISLYFFIIALTACRSEFKTDSVPSALLTTPSVFSLKSDPNVYDSETDIIDSILVPEKDIEDTVIISQIIQTTGTVVDFDSIYSGQTEVVFQREPQSKLSDRIIGNNIETLKVNPDSIQKTYFSFNQIDSDLTTITTGIIKPLTGLEIISSPPPDLKKTYPSVQKENATENIRFYDIDQGMISSHVLSMYQDSRNNIWFGTYEGGVTKFDGTYFSYFTKKEGLCANTVTAILEDSHGNMWFGSHNSGVSRYDGHHMINFSRKNGFSDDLLQSIVEDDNGNIWLATFGDGLYCILNAQQGSLSSSDPQFEIIHFTSNEGLPSNTIYSMLKTKDGTIWCGTYGKGVCYFDPANLVKEKTHGTINDSICFNTIPKSEGLLSNNILSILQDKNGYLWFGTNSYGISRYSPPEHNKSDFGILVNYTTQKELEHNIVRSMTEDRDGNIWLTTDKGVNRLNLSAKTNQKQNTFTRFTVNEGLSNNSVYSSLCDDAGNIWLGTQGAGVNYLGTKSFSHFHQEHGLSSNMILSIYENKDGNLWFGTYEGGINTFNGSEFINYASINNQIGRKTIKCILADSKNNLWLGTNNEGIMFSRTSNNDAKLLRTTHYMAINNTKNNYISSIQEDQVGNLWITTMGNGAFCYPKSINKGKPLHEGKLIHFGKANGLLSDFVYCMTIDKSGNLWLGTKKGVSKLINGNDRFFIQNFYNEKKLGSSAISAIFEDSQGDIWFGDLGSGLYHLKGGLFYNYNTKSGLSGNVISSIVEDKLNQVWVSTISGINRLYFDKNEIKKPENVRIDKYDRVDGLKGVDFFRGSVCSDSKNNIWWGNGKSLTKLDLTHFKTGSDGPKVQLNGIEINGKQTDFRNINPDSTAIEFDTLFPFSNAPVHLKVPFNQNHLTFYFSAIDWIAPHKVQCSYILEGLAESWSKPDAEFKADYRNIPHGTYTLKICAIGENGKWSQPYEYQFTVLPQWWNTPIARTCFFILAILMLVTIINWRTHQLKKQRLGLIKKVDSATQNLRDKNLRITKQNEIVKKQNKIVVEQKREIEAQFKEITDSIVYAKRIQSAILYSTTLIKKYLKESFVVYKPKDVVAGDFYWVAQKDDKTLFAAADCTGHGVPGAMVSVICSHALNRAVREYGLTDPGKILDKTREIVLEEFSKSDEGVKDGMDIALCLLEGNKLKYSGAYNPLWLIRDDELIITKADKQPVGRSDTKKPYTTHSFDLQKGDIIYLFTDGYADQFGGENNKKFMSKRFRALLLEIHKKSMETQKAIIEETFKEWKGTNEQIDDVCVIGVRIN